MEADGDFAEEEQAKAPAPAPARARAAPPEEAAAWSSIPELTRGMSADNEPLHYERAPRWGRAGARAR